MGLPGEEFLQMRGCWWKSLSMPALIILKWWQMHSRTSYEELIQKKTRILVPNKIASPLGISIKLQEIAGGNPVEIFTGCPWPYIILGKKISRNTLNCTWKCTVSQQGTWSCAQSGGCPIAPWRSQSAKDSDVCCRQKAHTTNGAVAKPHGCHNCHIWIGKTSSIGHSTFQGSWSAITKRNSSFPVLQCSSASN